MFGGNGWLGSIGGGLEDHSQKEREPPARPFSPEFPTYVPPFNDEELTLQSSNYLRDKLCRVRTLSDISDTDLARLNIQFTKDVEILELLPADQFAQRPLLFDDDLDLMLAEICVPNEDAFRETLRMEPLPGHAKPRLAYARNFFGSLEDLARYWDSSRDNYYHKPVSNHPGTAKQNVNSRGISSDNGSKDEPMDLVRTDRDTENTISHEELPTKEYYRGYRFGNGDQTPAGSRVALVRNLLKIVMHKFQCRDHEPMPSPREKFVFRGVKVQSVQYHFSVAKVPADAKLARARYVEGPLMAVSCREETRFKTQLEPLSAEALLTRQTSSDTATTDNIKAVNGKTRPGFGSAPLAPRYDFLREVGCMLILADQRSREHKSRESYSGAERWWVTKHRWGGGPTKWGNLAMDIFEDEDPSWSPEERALQEAKRQKAISDKEKKSNAAENVLSANVSMDVDALMASNAPMISAAPGDPVLGPRKKKLRSLDRPAGKDEEYRDGRRVMYVPHFKKKWYSDWEKLKPNAPTWDDKIVYKQIGKPTGQFDEIYMLTSVNHHIALVKMRVHSDYLEWVNTGRSIPKGAQEDNERKDVLTITRSKWFDMFNIEARKELLTAIWRLMCYLNRDSVDPKEFEKMEDKRQSQAS